MAVSLTFDLEMAMMDLCGAEQRGVRRESVEEEGTAEKMTRHRAATRPERSCPKKEPRLPQECIYWGCCCSLTSAEHLVMVY